MITRHVVMGTVIVLVSSTVVWDDSSPILSEKFSDIADAEADVIVTLSSSSR